MRGFVGAQNSRAEGGYMDIAIDWNESVEMVDLGDATQETRQVWFGTQPDSTFGLGWFRG